MQIQKYVDHDVFSPALLADALRTTQSEVADTLGLTRDAVTRLDRMRGPKTQTRLREMIEILNRVEPQLGSLLAAYAWYRSEPLPGFGGMTAQHLVREGKVGHVHAALDRMHSGGFA